MATHVGIPKPMLVKISEEKKRTGLTVSEIIRRALDDYFTKRKGEEAR